MSHEITERRDGTAEAAFAEKAAWHGLGTVVDHAMTSEEALELAGLNWDVLQLPLGMLRQEPLQTPEGEILKSVYHEVPKWFANVRSDAQDPSEFLGIVSDQYKIVQNREAFGFMDRLVEEQQLQYESAFSLMGGKKVVITARMPKVDTIVPGDDVLRYILMGLSHDGKSAIKFGVTPVRVVCWNTYSVAIENRRGVQELSLGHSGSMDDKLAEARRLLGVAGDLFESHAAESRQLAESRLTVAQWEQFLDIMCPVPSKADPDWTEYREKVIRETRDGIARNYHSGACQQLDGIRGTAWAAFNAVTEHIDHLPRRGADRTRRAEARFNVTQYGPGRDQKRRAFETLRRMAGIVA